MHTDYDVHGLVKELARLMRIQDWDIRVEYCGCKDMIQLHGEDSYTKGFCERYRQDIEARIVLNEEAISSDRDWLHTIVHELLHIVTDDFIYEVRSLYAGEEDEEEKSSTITHHYERVINHLAKGMINMVDGEKLLDRFRRVETDGKTKDEA